MSGRYRRGRRGGAARLARRLRRESGAIAVTMLLSALSAATLSAAWSLRVDADERYARDTGLTTVDVFLCVPALPGCEGRSSSAEAAARIAAKVADVAAGAEVTVTSGEENAAALAGRYGEGEIATAIEAAELPGVVTVVVDEAFGAFGVAAVLGDDPDVGRVQDRTDLDREAAERSRDLAEALGPLGVIQTASAAFAVSLAAAAAAGRRREENDLMHMMGAPRRLIVRPQLLTLGVGAAAGAAAGAASGPAAVGVATDGVGGLAVAVATAAVATVAVRSGVRRSRLRSPL